MSDKYAKFINASNYLTSLQPKVSKKYKHKINQSQLIDIIDDLESLNVKEFGISELENKLEQSKVNFNYQWALCDLSDQGTQTRRGKLQSQFAEISINFALKIAWRDVIEKDSTLRKTISQSNSYLPGLFILGLGKLGGNDLNFSSDVDLIAYFDPELLPIPETVGKNYIANKVLQKLTSTLNRNNNLNFIWRVDWRLRPNASANSLAISTSAAQDYYFYHASPWHRLALMKARTIAGDIDSGNDFLQQLDPFIWRQNLDFRSLDELADIKNRINLEHPSLRKQRKWTTPINDDIVGFNLKLGTGGIREAEFIANALQLIWGGRRRELRTTNTVAAFNALSFNKKLAPDNADKLIQYYQQLRRIENAIQILANQQSHLIPSTQSEQENLLTLLDIATWNELIDKLNIARYFIHENFNELFERDSDHHQEILWPTNISSKSNEIINNWESGYLVYGVSHKLEKQLIPLTSKISEYLSDQKTHHDTDKTILRLNDFFKSLPHGDQYFRLLAESPALLNSIIPPLLYSPAMSSLLEQSPHIVDCFLHSGWKYPQPFDGEYVLTATNYESKLELLRRFVNEHLYQLYLSFLNGEIQVDDFQLALTELAEYCLEMAIEIVCVQMSLAEPPISIIGLGKIAVRRMSPLSDLDLVFIYDEELVSLDLAQRFVARLQTAISTPMREGILYELDTRLRPSGKSGSPTVSIESFTQHHSTRAHNWEHIALLSSRVIAGKLKSKERFNAVKETIFFTPRSKSQFLQDAYKMWLRIKQHRISDLPFDIMNSKLRCGGLMQSEYLAACLIIIKNKSTWQRGCDYSNLLDQLTKQEKHNSNLDLAEIIQFWRINQLWERLLGLTGTSITTLREQYLNLFLAQVNVSTVKELIEKKELYANRIESEMTKLFSDIELDEEYIEQWQETNINWDKQTT